MYIEESGQRERNTYNMEAERKLEEKKLQELRETSRPPDSGQPCTGGIFCKTSEDRRVL